jgi:hypothetical protein
MKNFIVLIGWAFALILNANAFDAKLLANNKEAYSKELSKDGLSSASEWGRNHRLGEKELRTRSLKSLTATFNEMERIDTNCELGLVDRLQLDAKKQEVIQEDSETMVFINYLRQQDLIDDILYKILKDSADLESTFKATEQNRAKRPRSSYEQEDNIDLEKFYSPVKVWPDEVKRCSLDVYYNMTQNLRWKTTQDRDIQMQNLNYMALNKKIITLDTYNKLETLRLKKALSWPIYFKRYADIVNNAKDKLTKTSEAKSLNEFSTNYISRKESITKRSRLYAAYNSTQIMMLAQIMERTAKRMDSKRVSINWQYSTETNGEAEVYIFSPMEQYRLAIKMLRKEMAEVMRSDAFRGTGLEFEHLIAAAYETGFVKSSELDYVLKFEDFWNPKTPKWKTYTNFAFSLAGSASFYLPPPWNIMGALGLVLTQSKVNGEPEVDADENWNTII